MIKGLGNWTQTKRLMELVSYILKKKKILVGGGALNPVCEGIHAAKGSYEITGNKNKIVKEQPDRPYLYFNTNFKSVSF